VDWVFIVPKFHGSKVPTFNGVPRFGSRVPRFHSSKGSAVTAAPWNLNPGTLEHWNLGTFY
jgi:hypothetical protein